MPKLDNWSATYVSNDPFLAPELNWGTLQGIVSGHPEFRDGDFVIIGRIVDITEDNHIITKGGSEYTLGETDQGYEQLYPEAKLRLYEQLRKIFKKEQNV